MNYCTNCGKEIFKEILPDSVEVDSLCSVCRFLITVCGSVKLEYRFIQSASEEKTKHVVTLIDELPVACTCRAFIFGKQRDLSYACRHMGEALD